MVERALRLIAATRNRAKIAQLAKLVEDLAEVEPMPLDVDLPPEVAQATEAGDDAEAIASAKAVAWSAALAAPELVIATDGGLLVPALGERWQPTHTRRFAGAAANDRERVTALLELTKELEGAARQIGWREAIAIAREGRLLVAWSAESDPGMLAETLDERLLAHNEGFWVPALWRCPEFDNRLLAELSEDEAELREDHWRRLRVPLRNWLIDYRAVDDESRS